MKQQMRIDKVSSGRWRVRFLEIDGKWLGATSTFPTERKARAWGNEEMARRESEAPVDRRKSKMRLGVFAERYFWASKGHNSVGTMAHQKRDWRLYIEPYWGHVSLDDIEIADVVVWASRLAGRCEPGRQIIGVRTGKPLSSSMVWKVYYLFHQAVERAEELGYIPKASLPVHTPVPKPLTSKATRFLTPGEVRRLAELARLIGDRPGTKRRTKTAISQDETFVYLLGYVGLRIGEAIMLKVNDFDFERSTVHVDQSVVAGDNGSYVEGPPKKGSVRTVPSPTGIMSMVYDLIDEGVGWDDPEALVFLSPYGKRLERNNWTNKVFTPAATQAGLLPLTPHDLRHTAATMWISQGASLKRVAQRLGHVNTIMVDRVYGHLYPEDDVTLVAALDAAFLGAGDEASTVVSIRRPARPGGKPAKPGKEAKDG